MSATADIPLVPPERAPLPVPPDIEAGLQRGRQVMKRDAAKRRLCMRFERGDTWWWIDERSAPEQHADDHDRRRRRKTPA
jgi:hypothetical protein